MASILSNMSHQNYGNKYLIIKKILNQFINLKKQYKLFLLDEQSSE